MFGKHHSNLFRCFRKTLINHRPDHTINRISKYIQNVFCSSNSLSRDNNLSKKIFDQIDFIMLFNRPDELFFRIKKLNQSLLQHFPIIPRNGICFTILRPFRDETINNDFICRVEIAVISVAGHSGLLADQSYGNTLLALQQFVIGESNTLFCDGVDLIISFVISHRLFAP